MSEHLKLNNYSRPKLDLPGEDNNLLLHSCCAPCAGEIMEAVAASDIKTTVYFYNPNIHPLAEYEIRKDENKRFCDKLGFEFIDADYDKDNWFERIKGLENEPERGKRCTECFDMRFERSALYAHENNFGVYEPIHGSAPDIANQDIVNPIATILSVAMLFQHTFNRLDIYNHILSSVRLVLKDNKLTKDLSNNNNYVSTSDMGNFIVEKLKDTYGK